MNHGFFALVFASSLTLFAQAPPTHVKYEGLKGVGVRAAQFRANVESSGLTQDGVSQLVKSKLAHSKIPILVPDTAPHLSISLDSIQMPSPKVFVYHLELRLTEPGVMLPRNKEWRIPVTTWSRGMTGYCSPKRLKAEVEKALAELVQDFIAVYKKANP